MNIENIDLLNIAGSLTILVAGFTATLVSIPAIKRKEYTLMNFGLFFFLYGLRWLSEIPGIEIAAATRMPLVMSHLHSFLTYLIPIPFAAFLLNVMGRGLFHSMFWFFVSTVVYAVGAMVYDLSGTDSALSPSINTGVLALWCMIGGINVVLIREQNNTVLTILKITLWFFFICIAYDNLVVMGVFPWKFRLEHIDIFVLFAGMVYVAVRRSRDWSLGVDNNGTNPTLNLDDRQPLV